LLDPVLATETGTLITLGRSIASREPSPSTELPQAAMPLSAGYAGIDYHFGKTAQPTGKTCNMDNSPDRSIR
jgi:hypothetical protein